MKTRFVFTGMFIMAGIASVAQDSAHYPIILSSRWFHPSSLQDTLSTIKMIDVYHPDRIDWMYCTNSEQLAQLQERKIPYSLAINPLVPDSATYSVHGRIQDIDGNKLTAPWMRNWKMPNQYWGCVNAPEFQKVFYEESRKLIDLGAYGLFMDDARLNSHAIEWGGCFCKYSQTKQRLILVQTKTTRIPHKILLKSDIIIDPEIIHVLYPVSTKIQFDSKNNQVEIEYPNTMLVLSVGSLN